MSMLTLVIGNKNYSSWSLRPWMALTMAGIPFAEEMIWLDQPDTKAKIAAHSKAGRVPILRHGKLTIWESLAILEYLAEKFPGVPALQMAMDYDDDRITKERIRLCGWKTLWEW